MDARTPPRIVVIGLGAVGSVLTAALLEKDPSGIRVVVRAEHLAALRKSPLTLRGPLTKTYVLHPTSRIDFPLEHTLVIPMVKAYDLPAVIGKLKDRFTPTTRLLVLTNGLHIRDRIRRWGEDRIPPCQMFRGIVGFGATLTAPGQVRYFGGKVVLEEKFRSSPWFDRFPNPFFDVQISRNMEKTLWKKVLINSIYNPLSLLLRISNRTISHARLNPVKETLLREGLRIARAEGVEPKLTLTRLNRMVRSDNITSMYQDYRFNRPTEVDFITGEIVRCADKHGIPAPVHRFILSLVHNAVWIRDKGLQADPPFPIDNT